MAIGKRTLLEKYSQSSFDRFFSCAKASETKKKEEEDNFIAFYIVWRLILLQFHETDRNRTSLFRIKVNARWNDSKFPIFLEYQNPIETRAFIREKIKKHEIKNGGKKNCMGFRIPNVWQLRLAVTFPQA